MDRGEKITWLKFLLMKYCKLCLQPDSRPNTVFTEKGICPACSYFDALKQVDWQERFEMLEDVDVEEVLNRLEVLSELKRR